MRPIVRSSPAFWKPLLLLGTTNECAFTVIVNTARGGVSKPIANDLAGPFVTPSVYKSLIGVYADKLGTAWK